MNKKKALKQICMSTCWFAAFGYAPIFKSLAKNVCQQLLAGIIKKKIPQQLPLVRLDTKKKIKISLDDCQNSVLR